MKQDLYAHVCCPLKEPSARNVCFNDDVIDEYEKILNYGVKHLRPDRQRFIELAVPKRINYPYVPVCPCVFRKEVIVENLDAKFRLNTRTQQLALPAPRILELKRKEVCTIFDQKRMMIMNRLLRKSYYSMYSRLINAKIPACSAQKEPKKLTKKMRSYLRKKERYLNYRMRQLSRPKREIPQPEIERQSKPLSALKRLPNLALPKNRDEYEKPEWVFTQAMNKHKATDREKKLAEPKNFPNYKEPLELPIQVPPGALKYKASDRMGNLAIPKTLRKGESDLKDKPFTVAQNALKYRATKRIKEMAVPKERDDSNHIRANPNEIPPKALTYKATPRIINLARPKEH